MDIVVRIPCTTATIQDGHFERKSAHSRGRLVQSLPCAAIGAIVHARAFRAIPIATDGQDERKIVNAQSHSFYRNPLVNSPSNPVWNAVRQSSWQPVFSQRSRQSSAATTGLN